LEILVWQQTNWQLQWEYYASKEKLMERFSRFGLDVIYGLYKENRAKLNQLEDEAFYQLEVEDSLGYYYESNEVYYKRRSNI
jgi:hypothetical protein